MGEMNRRNMEKKITERKRHDTEETREQRERESERFVGTHLVLASIILIVTGFTPGIPGVTSLANTPVL
jgi:uncharacterized membrane protein